MNQKKSPRKINILAAILILVVGVFIGGYLVLKSGKISAGELSDILKGQTIDSTLCQPNVDDATKDSDNDGLKDWQEIQLYKTDPCKQDTDNDGYLDGEEVASGYDPAQKAPGDELPGTTPKTPRPLPNNLTLALQQKLSEQLLQNKISPLDANGNLLSSTELEQFPGIQQAVWEVTQHKDQIFAPEPIDESQIKTTSDNSKSSIQNYAGKMATAITSHSSDTPPSEVPTGDASVEEAEALSFLNAIQNNDFSELDNTLLLYQASYQNLKKFEAPVPTDLLLLHKEQINMFSSLIKIYQAIREINTDPLRANLALQQYQVISQELSDWMGRLAAVIESHQ